MAPLAGMIFLGEKISPLMWIGILIVTVGVFVVQWGQAQGKRRSTLHPIGASPKGVIER
jgi:drug/metabolite transporter (DMT)-like permease